jgi:hypothetical protein
MAVRWGVSMLYFETDARDGFRESGLSKSSGDGGAGADTVFRVGRVSYSYMRTSDNTTLS